MRTSFDLQLFHRFVTSAVRPYLGASVAAVSLLVAGSLAAQTFDLACTVEGAPAAARIARTKQAGERSFLFQTVRRRLGAPLSCRASGNEGVTQVSWSFAGDATYTFYELPAAEMVNHAVVMPGLTQGEALALLKEGEKHLGILHEGRFPGCGIDWNKPIHEKGGGLNIGGTNNVSYWGDGCNCHGRISYTGQKVIGLEMGLAC